MSKSKAVSFADMKMALQFHVTCIGVLSRTTAEALMPTPYRWATQYALEALEGDGLIVRTGPEKFVLPPSKDRAGRIPGKTKTKE